MIDVMRDCCEAMLNVDDGFWVTAALTTYSFETAGSSDFRRVVQSFTDAGLPAKVRDRLLRGVNDNLAAIIETRYPGRGPFSPNLGNDGERPDIRFGSPNDAAEVIAEVKVLHGTTTRKFYGSGGQSHSVVYDRNRKLLPRRSRDFKGHLFQIVFFVQLPAFERPAGTWASGVRSNSWRSYQVFSSIKSQYDYLRRFLIDPPAWPKSGPVIKPLKRFEPALLECITKRYASFRPESPWAFDADRHLADAAAGCAIWSY